MAGEYKTPDKLNDLFKEYDERKSSATGVCPSFLWCLTMSRDRAVGIGGRGTNRPAPQPAPRSRREAVFEGSSDME